MLKVKSGDLDKMALLFQRYHRPLYGFLYHMTGQKEASEDMVQNVFYRMLRSRHTFTGQGEFRTWMYHLARNVLKDHLKKDGRYRPMPDWEDRLAGEELVEEQLERKQELEMLQLKMESLSPESREVLVLSRYQDLKYSEIAGVLDISVAAVKVRIHRAIRQLRMLYLQTE
ncbi:RNA polymerase sigma factor [Puia sp. P3]|uniref:RNA polymerase sigma factor n=1 Tax=Puia sp. P3 TaxID=3423952 RepID=UPI003D6714F5